ncbi:MAG: hypothetical protein AB7E47_10470 [Desulfovibrionaceae bacterium]
MDEIRHFSNVSSVLRVYDAAMRDHTRKAAREQTGGGLKKTSNAVLLTTRMPGGGPAVIAWRGIVRRADFQKKGG